MPEALTTANASCRYCLPSVILLPFALRYVKARWFPSAAIARVVSNEDTLSATLADVHVIQHLLPQLPPLPPLPPLANVARIVTFLHVPYMLAVRILSVKLVFAIIGTIFLTWRSPWAIVTRDVLSRSGWIQWALQRTWTQLSGVPYASPALESSMSSKATTKNVVPWNPYFDIPEPSRLRFEFSVLENQRWWMGLDFSAALLPGERPSWSSPLPALSPLPPPGSLSLPGPSTVYLPLKDKGTSDVSASYRLKRTSKWKWDEPEWTVAVRRSEKDGSIHEDRVKFDLPKEVDAQPNTNTSRLVDAVGSRLRRAQNTSAPDPGSPTRETNIFQSLSSPDRDKHLDSSLKNKPHVPEDDLTDPEGWVYADNKWEGGSAITRGKVSLRQYLSVCRC